MRYLKLGISKLNATQLADKTRHIEAMMTGNVELPAPTPDLAMITAAREALEEAIVGAMDGGRTAMATRRARETELRALLKQLAGYVTSMAQGDELVILSSGFEVRRNGAPVGELPPPTGLDARISRYRGRIDLRWTPVPYALTYHVFRNATDPAQEDAWELVGVCSKATFAATGLESAKVHWFRVAAIGTAGLSPLSDVAHSLAA